MEKAAEIDRKKTVHLELTREGSLARSRMLFEMTRGNDDDETKSSNSSKRRSSKIRSAELNLQGSNSTSSVEIEMGTLTSSSSSSNNDDADGNNLSNIVESKEEVGEAPFKV